MLTTPGRSLMTPPSAARVSGVAVTSVWEPNTATSLAWMPTTSSAISCKGRRSLPLGDRYRGDLVAAEPEKPTDDLGGGHEGDHRRLHDRDQVGGNLGRRLQLHEAGAVVESAEKQSRGQDPPRVAAGEERDGDRVKAVTGGDRRRHV